MSTREDKRRLLEPPTREGAVNRRLRWARQQEGLSQAAWREQLLAAGATVSKSSVSDYERSMRSKNKGIKLPPLDYVAGVSEVFGYNLEWLISGKGEYKPAELEGAVDDPLESDPVTEGLLFGDLPELLRDIHWAGGVAGSAILRILSQADRAARRGRRRSRGELDPENAVELLAAHLNKIVPEGGEAFMRFDELAPWERQHALVHAQGLMYLLFRPFREADTSYVWSKALTRGSSGE